MNGTTREKIFATKEKLHQMTRRSGVELGKSIEEREKEQANKKAREDKEYLSQHNKKVSRILKQVAKGNRTSGEEDTEEEEREDSENDSNPEEVRPIQRKEDRGRGESRQESRENPTASTSTGT